MAHFFDKMQSPGYNTDEIRFSEGDWFPFKVHNFVQLQDGAWYYIMLDVNGSKHFMSAIGYESYNIRPGDEIICKIDKINCTGRIYLEPRHPHYNEGESYLFDIVHATNEEEVRILHLKEQTGATIQLPIPASRV